MGPGGSLQALAEKSLKGLGILQPLSPDPAPRMARWDYLVATSRAADGDGKTLVRGLQPEVLRLRYVAAPPISGEVEPERNRSLPACIDRVGREVP